MSVAVIIPSAGSGSRMKLNENKIFLPINGGKSVLYNTLELFCDIEYVDTIYLPCREEDEKRILEIASSFDKKIVTVRGGERRSDSVRRALELCAEDYVLVHDCARPFASRELVDRVYESVKRLSAVIPVLPASDTIKVIKDGVVLSTPDRSKLGLVQTPQGFLTSELKRAYDSLDQRDNVTDDASVYERIGKVYTVEGEKANIKLTTIEDVKRETRIGVGFDAHRFEKGREMWLGGIKLDLDYGLLGHSDADVVLHAIMDALLSAVHLRDIGVQFPCTPEYKDVSSVKLFEKVMAMLEEKNASIVNISAVIVAEKPKLAPYIDKMVSKIAGIARVSEDRVSLTATTTEKLGFTGREEGIAVEATCIVEL